jgi:hypothetical protein
VTLGKEIGWIAGYVVPKTAKVSVQDIVGGSPGYPTVTSTGHFNVSRIWGSYWVNATLGGYKTCSEFLTVFPGQTNASPIIAPCTLWAPRIEGTVNPATGTTLTINGTVETVTGGEFNVTLPGNATYTVTATKFGYSVYNEAIVLPTGVNKTLSIVLTDQGWISGTVSPVNAGVQVDLTPETVVDGAFNITEAGSNIGLHEDYFDYTLTVAALGYTSQTITVRVTPGNTTVEQIKLVVANGHHNTGCNGTACCVNGTGTNCSGRTTSTNYTDLYVGLAVIIVLIAVIAVALMMRRPGGKSGASGTPPPASTSSPPSTGPTDGGPSPPPPQ